LTMRKRSLISILPSTVLPSSIVTFQPKTFSASSLGFGGNLTPRSAARTKSGREKLAVCLKHFENRSRQPEATDPMATYDFAWLWRELKVEDLRR
jgi:hypothetical protein